MHHYASGQEKKAYLYFRETKINSELTITQFQYHNQDFM